MSLYGALFSGVSALQSQSNRISILSNNISNVNTVGYKGSEGLFESLVTNSSSGGVGGGVIGNSRQLVDQQGLLQSTNSPTDIAISGRGFFVVNQAAEGTGQVFYTRSGNFTQDSLGNFRNAAGFYLQAWPLDRDGRLPGEPGNTQYTTSNANLNSLITVNVQNLTGAASATTNVSIGANLDADQDRYLGAGPTFGLDSTDTVNYGTSGQPAKSIIVPSAVNSLTIGDKFTVTTDDGVDAEFTYGGFTYSRSVVSGANPADGSATATTGAASGQVTLNNTPITVALGDLDTDGTTNNVVVTVTSVSGLAVGNTVTLAGITTDVGGIPFAQLTGDVVITAIDTLNNTFTFQTAATSTSAAGSTEAGTATPRPFITTNGSGNIIVTQNAHGLQTGDVVNFSGVTGTFNGVSAAQLNNDFVITRLNANQYQITLASSATASGSGGGGAGTVISDNRIFTGRILNATLSTDRFLGTEPTSSFTGAALSFNIATSTTSYDFTYTVGTPNTQIGQFNTLNNLAAAINAKTDLSARVVNNQLYIGGIDANDSLTFTNGSTTGASGPPVLRGIDWVGELGLANVTAIPGGRFNSLQGLSDVVNNTDGLLSTVINPTGASSITINASNPLATVTFDDGQIPVGTANQGSVLAALGIVPTLGLTTAPVTPQTKTFEPSYDPADPDRNMASGNIVPQFSRPIQIFDALGTPHNLTVGFIKTGINTWAAEVFMSPASDVSTIAGDGLLAYGDIAFNGDGTLGTISPTLTGTIPITWNADNNGSASSEITIDWGTAGPISVGQADGLAQFASDYRVSFINQNGTPVGQLSGIAIDEDGVIIASFTNGDTQALFKIPIAEFSDPNALEQRSAGAFSQTQGSGTVNLSQAGVGGAGEIVANALEASNVDLAGELTDMIVAQRAYQAGAKIITTADNLLEELNQSIR